MCCSYISLNTLVFSTRDTKDNSHSGHVGVPNKRKTQNSFVKSIPTWTPRHQIKTDNCGFHISCWQSIKSDWHKHFNYTFYWSHFGHYMFLNIAVYHDALQFWKKSFLGKNVSYCSISEILKYKTVLNDARQICLATP